MRPILMSGEFDPFQVAIIVIFVIAGFIKWVWENWQMSQAAKKSAPQADPEEQHLREEAWRRQTGQSAPPPVPSRTPPSSSSSWDELRKAWTELKEAARQAPARPAQPPPVPPKQVRRGSVRAALSAPPPEAPRRSAPDAAMPVTTVPVLETRISRPASPFLAVLQNLRHDPALMRQAILMQEILGPPKALQTSADPAI